MTTRAGAGRAVRKTPGAPLIAGPERAGYGPRRGAAAMPEGSEGAAPRWSRSGRAARAVAAALGLGCGGPPAPAAPARTPDTAGPPPAAWDYTPSASDAPPGPELVAADAQRVLDAIPTVRAAAALAAWGQVHALAEPRCPSEIEASSSSDGDTTHFELMCRTSRGVWFKGPFTTWSFADNRLDTIALAGELRALHPDLRLPFTGAAMRGQVDVFDEDGTLDFNCSCTALEAAHTTDAGVRHALSYVDGPVHWEAPQAPAAWFDGGRLAQLYVHTERAPDGGTAVFARGALTGFTDAHGSAQVWMELRTTPTDAARCWVDRLDFTLRTPSGARTQVSFGAADAACVSCADLDGERICVDLSAYADSAELPW